MLYCIYCIFSPVEVKIFLWPKVCIPGGTHEGFCMRFFASRFSRVDVAPAPPGPETGGWGNPILWRDNKEGKCALEWPGCSRHPGFFELWWHNVSLFSRLQCHLLAFGASMFLRPTTRWKSESSWARCSPSQTLPAGKSLGKVPLAAVVCVITALPFNKQSLTNQHPSVHLSCCLSSRLDE